jgi:hypothetical protein
VEHKAQDGADADHCNPAGARQASNGIVSSVVSPVGWWLKLEKQTSERLERDIEHWIVVYRQARRRRPALAAKAAPPEAGRAGEVSDWPGRLAGASAERSVSHYSRSAKT